MINSFLRYILSFFPLFLPGSPFRVARTFIWKLSGYNLHSSVNILPTARIIYGKVSIGMNTFIGDYVLITGGSIAIGNNCDIAPRCVIHAGSHELGLRNRRAGKIYAGTIEIGDGTWIGTNATILAGAKIGKGVIVAAGAVVIAGEYPDDILLAGTPAKIKKKLM